MNNTLCWDCQNAVPDLEGKRGCNWSRHHKPVEGWDAVRQIHATVAYSYVSYEVIKCPQFLADERYIPVDYQRILQLTRKGQRRIPIYRQMFEITQTKMANDLGKTRSWLYQIENNYRKLTEEELEQIANYLAVDKSEFIKGGKE